MNLIRQHFLSRIFALLTGLVFLNMSFFLAEVSFMKFNKKELIENIAKLILNSGFEEERDCESGMDTMAKEIDLTQQVRIHHTSSFLISVSTNRTLVNHYRHANHSLTFSPPPDLSLLS